MAQHGGYLYSTHAYPTLFAPIAQNSDIFEQNTSPHSPSASKVEQRIIPWNMTLPCLYANSF